MFEKSLFRFWGVLGVVSAMLALSSTAYTDVFNMPEGLTSLETVPVGNLGNTGEISGYSSGVPGAWGPDRVCGAVNYNYCIGKYEVTAGQYCEFLNAVAAVDTYELYNINMADTYGTQIIQAQGPEGFTYSVAPDWANRPVNYVSWADAARFANWLHNGQPTGAQDLSTTEDGAYFLNGARTVAEVMAVTRKADWKWAIPTEDEWYKAAYHKNDGDTGNYYEYPTSNDSEPSNDLVDPDPGNNACFSQDGYTIGYPYMMTEVGAFENSDSPYGTFDQGGNVWEWNEANFDNTKRGCHGGGWYGKALYMIAGGRGGIDPTLENDYYNDDYFGFRVVSAVSVLAGDYDLDGDVDGEDFLIWQRTDGTKPGLDSWVQNFGTLPGATPNAAVPVPEPSTAMASLFLMVAIGIAVWIRNRR